MKFYHSFIHSHFDFFRSSTKLTFLICSRKVSVSNTLSLRCIFYRCQLMANGVRGQLTARAVDHVVVVDKPNTEHVPILHPLMEGVTVLGLPREARAVILTLAVQVRDVIHSCSEGSGRNSVSMQSRKQLQDHNT